MRDGAGRALGVTLVGGSSHPGLVAAMARAAGCPAGGVRVTTFANRQRLVHLGESVRGRHVYVVQTTTDTDPDRDIVELFQIVDAVKRASAEKITLVLPLFPYVRSEKKDQPRIPITASMLAGILEEYFAPDGVITVDLHTPAEQGFFRKISADELWAAPLFACALPDLRPGTHKLVATDAGAAKNLGRRYEMAFGLDVASIQKERIDHTEKTRPVGLAGDVAGRSCILFDDEIATGSTLVGDAELLLARGAKDVIACVTHGVLVGRAPENIARSPLKQLLVSDTVPVPRDKLRRASGKIRVVSCAKLLARAVARSARGESMQPLLSTEFVRGVVR